MNLTPLRSAPVLPRSTTNGLPSPSDTFEWRQAPWGDVLICRAMEEAAAHFFTGRQLQLRGEPSRSAVDWERVAHALGLPVERLWRMRQVHGCDVLPVSETEIAEGDPHVLEQRPAVDALITDRADVALGVQVADCVPLLLADPRTGAVAATHGGWRGTAANIAAATVARLVREYDVQPVDLIAAIGPSIGPSCFQVGPEVREVFINSAQAPLQPADWFVPDTGDRLRLDLWRATHDQLVAAGLRPDRIHIARLCTVTHVSHFFSYRVEREETGRMLGAIRRLQSGA